MSGIPVTVIGISDAVDIGGGGGYHSCAILRNTGAVKYWGRDNHGTLENPDISGNTVDAVGTVNVTMVVGGFYHTCILQKSGKIWCWGPNPESLGLTGISNVIALTAEHKHTCQLWCYSVHRFGCTIGRRSTY